MNSQVQLWFWKGPKQQFLEHTAKGTKQHGNNIGNKIEHVLTTELPVATEMILPIKVSPDMPMKPKVYDTAALWWPPFSRVHVIYYRLLHTGPLFSDSNTPSNGVKKTETKGSCAPTPSFLCSLSSQTCWLPQGHPLTPAHPLLGTAVVFTSLPLS